ncbi:sugar transporter [Renibacterium salmoninarum ATCC 33209]|uniref:Sugar transporter n=1 Tax=Renibacterium salmoninarum (strain ATCC 33209 / DSM 20767 / JCM 11484 / NBRC 15589 / NCIMB 2235) TaxID=288705 RepID=A9WMV0_RENSM|nr:MFS transporter [Renibacterium salmoninarum]ABY23411.1 sugar transporter [Renibacterium salmoninarum ATCC 33209]
MTGQELAWHRWIMLALAVAAQAASSIVVNGMAFLIPTLNSHWGLNLVQSGLLVAMPLLGTMVVLFAWGAIIDRIGERLSLGIGLSLTAVTMAAAALSNTPLWLGISLFFAGVATACTNSAGGRIVVGWFPAKQRGLAMGIRQMAQPLGVGIASVLLPVLAAQSSLQGSLWSVVAISAVVATLCWIGISNPPRRARREDPGAEKPYRGNNFLLRIHAVSAILVIPQFTVWTFSLVWLMGERHLEPALAGLIIAGAQVAGALGRIGVGVWSDRVGSRVRPLRAVALAAAVSMLALALTDWLDSPLSVVLLIVASVMTVADNGLAFTSVAETAGPYWSGRTFGAQNTGQFLIAAVVPPTIGALITVLGYPLSFAVVGLSPLIAAPFIPNQRAERKAVDAAG